MLHKAYEIASKAHAGQLDKAGEPYKFHIDAVAAQMKTEEEMAVAYLHDTLEDTDLTAEDLLNAGIPENVVDAVKVMTHDPAVPYMDYIASIKKNELARKVKIADLMHNSCLIRLDSITQKDIERCRKYMDALQVLIS
jgi:(p)ppGpp synthase/HD superfamily hydrolase